MPVARRRRRILLSDLIYSNLHTKMKRELPPPPYHENVSK